MRLAVHIQTLNRLRNIAGGDYPDPVSGAAALDLAGADGIVFQYGTDPDNDDRDLNLLKAMVKSHLSVEIEPNDSLISKVIEAKPDQVTLIPAAGEDPTAGLDVTANDLAGKISTIQAAGVDVSILVAPDIAQIKAVRELKADLVTINVARYTLADNVNEALVALEDIESAALGAANLGLRILVARGINYRNIGLMAGIDTIEEGILDHALFARSVYIGMDKAMAEVRDAVRWQGATE